MTECHSNSIDFAGVGRRKVVADFDGGRLTTDAGILLLREVDRRIGLVDAISDCLPDPRDPRYTTHEQRAKGASGAWAAWESAAGGRRVAGKLVEFV